MSIDMPLGLGMRLAQDPEASENFWRLTPDGRAQIISYVQGGTTGEDAKKRITATVANLKNPL